MGGEFVDADVVAEQGDQLAGVTLEQARQVIDEAAKLGDADTADLFTGHSSELDKSLCFLEAHLQG